MDIFAHAGSYGPQNSAQSLLAADSLGFTRIEFDLVEEGGELFVAHDKGSIGKEWTLSLEKMLPTLSSLKTPLLCDIKSLGIEEEVAFWMKKAGLEAKTMFCGHLAEGLRLLRSFLPEAAIGWSVPQPLDLDEQIAPFPDHISLLEGCREDLPEKVHTVLQENRFDGVMCCWPFVSKKLVDKMRGSGFFVNTWTVDKEEEAKTVAACGVDSITSNYPEKIEKSLFQVRY